MSVRLKIEVVAEDLEDALGILGAARRELKKAKISAAGSHTIGPCDFCDGGYHVVVDVEEDRDPPFRAGDVVRDKMTNQEAVVAHCGPSMCGIRFKDNTADEAIVECGDLELLTAIGNSLDASFRAGDLVRHKPSDVEAVVVECGPRMTTIRFKGGAVDIAVYNTDLVPR